MKTKGSSTAGAFSMSAASTAEDFAKAWQRVIRRRAFFKVAGMAKTALIASALFAETPVFPSEPATPSSPDIHSDAVRMR